MSYYRSMYGIDICNDDLNYCLLRAKQLCLTPDSDSIFRNDQHAQVNCFYEFIVSKKQS